MNVKLLTTAEAAEFLGLAKPTLDCWRSRGGGPVFRRVGRRAVRYDLADLQIFAGDRRKSTSDPGVVNQATSTTAGR